MSTYWRERLFFEIADDSDYQDETRRVSRTVEDTLSRGGLTLPLYSVPAIGSVYIDIAAVLQPTTGPASHLRVEIWPQTDGESVVGTLDIAANFAAMGSPHTSRAVRVPVAADARYVFTEVNGQWDSSGTNPTGCLLFTQGYGSHACYIKVSAGLNVP